MFRLNKRFTLFSSVLLLAACGSKLLWEARYTPSGPKSVTATSTDPTNNSYIGSGVRVGLLEDSTPEYQALMLKYDASGTLLWQSELPDAAMILAIAPVNTEVIAVVTGIRGVPKNATNSKSSALWLVSATTGAPIQEVTRFDNPASADNFHKLKVINQRIYLARGSNDIDCAMLIECDYHNASGTLQIYNAQGTLLNQHHYNKDIADFDVSADNTVSVALYGQAVEVQALDAGLQPLWSASMPTRNFYQCALPSIRRQAGNTHLLCDGGLVKLDSTGTPLFDIHFDDLVGNGPTGNNGAETASFWHYNGLMDITDSGDIFVAKTRPTAYIPGENGFELGPVTLYATASLKSDAVLMKINGGTGDILWSDDVNTPLSVSDENLQSFYYSPLGLSISGNKVLLTIQAIGAAYDYCYNLQDWSSYFPNTCHLDHYIEQYGKTFAYAENSGARLTELRHSIAHPRQANLDAQGKLVVAGDMESGYVTTMTEYVASGHHENAHVDYSDSSDIVVQKSQF